MIQDKCGMCNKALTEAQKAADKTLCAECEAKWKAIQEAPGRTLELTADENGHLPIEKVEEWIEEGKKEQQHEYHHVVVTPDGQVINNQNIFLKDLCPHGKALVHEPCESGCLYYIKGKVVAGIRKEVKQ